eukprot:9436324-Karenia_brevis.AAC.1
MSWAQPAPTMWKGFVVTSLSAFAYEPLEGRNSMWQQVSEANGQRLSPTHIPPQQHACSMHSKVNEASND